MNKLPGLELEAAILQYLAYLGKQLLAELVVVEQAAELQHRCRVRNRLTTQFDADESAQARTVVQRLLASLVGQVVVEPMLDEVDAPDALESDWGRPPILLG